jgi:ABC-type transport system substrate-binding protein
MNYEPLRDVRVRKALSLLMDPEQIVLAGWGSPEFGWTGRAIFPPPWNLPEEEISEIMWWDKPFEERITEAQRLMAEAGYADGFSFTLMSWPRPGTPEIPAVLEATAGYWEQNLKLKITIVQSDLPTYNREVRPRNTVNKMAPNRWSTRMEQQQRIFSYYLPESDRPMFTSPEFIILCRTVIAAIDPDDRDVAWNAFFKYMREQSTNVSLLQIPNNYAYNQNKILKGSWPHGAAPYPQYYQYIKHAEPLNTFRLFDIAGPEDVE